MVTLCRGGSLQIGLAISEIGFNVFIIIPATLLTALSLHLCQNPVKFATLDFEFTDCLHLDLAIEALFRPYKC